MDNITLSTESFNKRNALLPDQAVNTITFHGVAGDYFALWLKNLILCILTLGIYLPWAIVSRRRYFMNATEINHARFEYHARPTDILSGFLLTGLGVIISLVLSASSPTLAILLMIALILLMPYMLIRLWDYNVRNTSYQGCHFSYRCGYLRLYWALIILPVLLFIAVVLLNSEFMHWYIASSSGENVDNAFRLMFIMSLIPFTGLSLLWSVQGKQIPELLINNLSFGQTSFSVSLLYKKLMMISLISVLILLLFMLAGFSQLEDLVMVMMIPEEAWPEQVRAAVIMAVALFYLLFFCGILIAGIYFRAACGTYVVNSTELGNLRFRCDVTFWSYLILILTNILLVICTLGFGGAFAEIRHARYLANHIRIIGDINTISGGNKEEPRTDRSKYESVIISAD